MADNPHACKVHDAVRNMWLAGMSFDEVSATPHYRLADTFMQSELIDVYHILDLTFDRTCRAYGIHFEPARKVRIIKPPPQKNR